MILSTYVATVTDMDSTSVTSEQEVDSGVESTNSADNMVYLRIAVPELNAQKCLQFHQDDTVWVAKQRVLSVAKTLKDGFNYGLFCPPMHGKAGKFLDEERPLKDYPLPGPIGYLEFKFKRRIYKQMQMNPRKLKQIHTKANLKQMMEAVKKNDVNKVTKFTNSGLDPNFDDRDTGETPLTQATMLSHPAEMVLAIVSGGAHLDFRNKKGLTPLHTAAQAGNEEALRILLDLGASTNYKDKNGLTPLYHTVCSGASARCVEIFLYDHAVLGVCDEYGWTEMHQASKAGSVQHLEQLIYYGADMNCQNSSGNTPLHVCAINQQEECARVLLFRGARKEIQNFANQDAFELAIISGNTQLALMIKEFAPEAVVPYKDFPKYSDKRRSCVPASTFSTLQRSRSNPQLHQLFQIVAPDSSQRLACDGLFDVTKRREQKGIRRRTELAFVSEFMADGPFQSNSPRSLSVSSSGSGQGGDLALDLKSPALSLPEYEEGRRPRTVVLQEGENGFGFILRGAKAPCSGAIHLDFVPLPELPALQYFEQVEQSSPADVAGIRPGDFLLEVNGKDVRAASHDYTVRLIKGSDAVLSLTVLTSTLSRTSDCQSPVTESSAPLRILRRNSFNSLRSSGLAELESLDRFLLEYESLDRRSVCGGSYNGSLGLADGAVDPGCKVASIKSVHGKRLTPAVSKLDQWEEYGAMEASGMWKARSAHCLVSSAGRLTMVDELDKLGARNLQKAVGASHLSLNQQGGGISLPSNRLRIRPELPENLFEKPQNAEQENAQSKMAAVKLYPPRPAMKVLEAPVKTHQDSSCENPYRVMHSFSQGTDGNPAKVCNPALQTDSRITSTIVQSVGSETRQGSEPKPEAGQFKVPPPPPPMPSKHLPGAPAPKPQSNKVKPAVPRRRSQVIVPPGRQEVDFRLPVERATEVHPSWKTKPAGSSGAHGDGKCNTASDSQNFLALAEAARLHYLNQKSNDLNNPLETANSVLDSTLGLNENQLQPVFDKVRLPGCDGTMAKFEREVKVVTEQKMKKELTFQEELKNSLSARCLGGNRRLTIAGGVESFLSKSSAKSCEPGSVIQNECRLEERDDILLGHRKSISHEWTAGDVNTPENRSRSKLLCNNDNTGSTLTDSFVSCIIPPPPLFLSRDPSSENSANSRPSLTVNQSRSFTPVNISDLDLASWAPPPPPPGFEDALVVPDTSSPTETKSHVEKSNARDSTWNINRSVRSWSVDEVCSWLEVIHMAEHVPNFRQNQIDGCRLSVLGRNELISLGVKQVGQRMTIERAIKKAVLLNP